MSPNGISYTDLNSMSELKAGSKANSPENMERVAEQFESLFMNMMVKSMRDANQAFAEGNPLNTPQTRFYQDMYDNQMSVHLSEKQGLGLADVMMRQLSPEKTPAASNTSLERPVLKTDLPVESSKGNMTGGVPDHSALLAKRRLGFSLGHGAAQMALAANVPTPASAPVQAEPAQAWQPLRAMQGVARSQPTTADAIAQGARVSSAGPSRFADSSEFVQAMLPMAEKAAARLGVDPHYLVAQAALETGWGKSIIKQPDGSNSHNLFGIKAHGGWQGESANVTTHEYRNGVKGQERANFRSYASFEQSFDDYVNFLEGNGRYKQALARTENPDTFFRELQQAGYATDPQYARKVSQIARQLLSDAGTSQASQVAQTGDSSSAGRA
ncbi:flagellar assembly peptidoglycan hydrolase FlgJ [Halopseudomonas sp.]|uniref:flagellar assembly peptidoglycan hydrolase FlgJ n=1 Tax=Halopseudomonas sp. TaxID=2901191 RepID=UPI0035684A5C